MQKTALKIDPYLISLVKKINPLDMIGIAEERHYYNVAKERFDDQRKKFLNRINRRKLIYLYQNI